MICENCKKNINTDSFPFDLWDGKTKIICPNCNKNMLKQENKNDVSILNNQNNKDSLLNLFYPNLFISPVFIGNKQIANQLTIIFLNHGII